MKAKPVDGVILWLAGFAFPLILILLFAYGSKLGTWPNPVIFGILAWILGNDIVVTVNAIQRLRK